MGDGQAIEVTPQALRLAASQLGSLSVGLRAEAGAVQAALAQAIAAAGGQATSTAVSRFCQVRVAALVELAEGLGELEQRLGAAAEGYTVTDQTAMPASREHVR
jgi:uncharacterized protein YukE